jgi:hypothetical protein
MIRAIFVQGAIAAALLAPLAVLTLGKWRCFRSRSYVTCCATEVGFDPAAARHSHRGLRLPVHVLLLLRCLENPELQRFYGGPELATFWVSLRHNRTSARWIYGLAALRALIYIACVYPLVRMLHTSRWESAFAAALFSACWTAVLLLPNCALLRPHQGILEG